MQIQMIQDLNNCTPPPPISSNPNTIIGKKPGKMQESIKFKIKTQPGKVHSEP